MRKGVWERPDNSGTCTTEDRYVGAWERTENMGKKVLGEND